MRQRVLAAALLVMAGCATVKAPTGGPKDATPPEVVAVDPPARTTFFDAQRIVFTFNEFLRPNLEATDVFISPRPAEPFDAYVVNKRLIVKLPKGEWARPEQTYVITLGTRIADNTAGNRLARSVQYAFSTGGVVDSFEVSGQVIDLLKGEPQQGYLVGLFRADSLDSAGTFAELNPAYIAVSDDKGVFSLAYLAEGKYFLLGFQDIDNGYAWSGPAETLALDDLDTLRLSRSNPRELRNLYTSVVDTTAPRLARYRVLNATNYRLMFTEGLRSGSFTFRDSTWNWADTASYTPFYRDSTDQIVLRLPPPVPTDTFDLHITAQDTAGNLLDTLLRIAPPRTDVVDYLEVIAAEKNDSPFALRYFLSDWIHPDTLARYVFLRDTTDSQRPIMFEQHAHQLTVLVPDTLTRGYPYELVFDSLLTSATGFAFEEAKVYTVTLPDDRRLGRLLGEVSGGRPVLVDLLLKGKLVRRQVGPRIDFTYLQPGTYQLRVIEDLDGNGVWTAGTLYPTKRTPEPVVVYPDEFIVRGGWENEQTLVYPPGNQ